MKKILTLLFITITVSSFSQEIALTFDDAPTPDVALFNGDERTDRIIKHLAAKKTQAAFFVVTANINEQSKNRLQRYIDSNHLIANHTHSHRWIHQIGTKQYIADLQKADSTLKNFKNFTSWFRYPFLDEGRTRPVRDSIRAALTELKLTNGYVTIDNYDWYINGLLSKAKRAGKQIDFTKLKEVYLDHIWTSIQFYDNIAKNTIGRSPKHVLLLHENDLSALFLTDLIDLLQQKGWKIISPTEAYTDPISTSIPDVLFNGQGRIGALAKEKGVAGKDLVQQSEDEEFLDALVASKNIFN
jgi:peptidoglycan-N-acetylglucosamine deacetylase